MNKSTPTNITAGRAARLGLCAAICAAGIAATAPGTAHADDAAIKQAVLNWMPRINGDADQVDTALSGKITRGKLSRTIRLIRHLDTDLTRLTTAIKAQQPSTPDGTTGQADAVLALSLTVQSDQALIRALRATVQGKRHLAEHDLVVAETFEKEARQPGNEADKALGLPPHTLGY